MGEANQRPWETDLSPVSLLLTFPPSSSHFSSEELIQAILFPAFTAISQQNTESESVKIPFSSEVRILPIFLENKGLGKEVSPRERANSMKFNI